jgi:hypothetical protein
MKLLPKGFDSQASGLALPARTEAGAITERSA